MAVDERGVVGRDDLAAGAGEPGELVRRHPDQHPPGVVETQSQGIGYDVAEGAGHGRTRTRGGGSQCVLYTLGDLSRSDANHRHQRRRPTLSDLAKRSFEERHPQAGA